MIKRAARSVAAGFRALGRRLPGVIIDFVGLAGAASISYGAWLIYVPAGFIVAGFILAAGAYRLAGRIR